MIFSIIIPIYNVAKYLDECISSVQNQNFSDYELILVDDGSTDESGIICKKYAEQDLRIKYIFKENGGLTSARKAGAQIAKGEYILCLDGDDALLPECLSNIGDIIEKYRPDCICTNFKMIMGYNLFKIVSDGMPIGYYQGEDLATVRENLFYSQSIEGNNSGRIHWNIWSKAIKREIYVPCQLSISEDISLGEDIVLTSLIINKLRSVYFSDVIAHKYLVRRDSISHSFTIDGVESIIKVLLQVKENIRNENQVAVLSVNVFLSELSKASKKLSYKDVKRMLLIPFFSNIEINRLINVATIHNATLKDSIKMFLVKRRLFYLLYLYYKYFSV